MGKGEKGRGKREERRGAGTEKKKKNRKKGEVKLDAKKDVGDAKSNKHGCAAVNIKSIGEKRQNQRNHCVLFY